MCPNIVLGSITLSSWYTFLAIGILIPVALAIILRPSDFPLTRIGLLKMGVLVSAAGLVGARVLFLFLHKDSIAFNIQNIFSLQGGYAYFGALIACVLFLLIYAVLEKVSFVSLLDYSAPFLMLSQTFVRIGCLMAGCCYGKPAGSCFGIIFKSVDKVPRHPTQGYEAALLLVIFFAGRAIYNRYRKRRGLTFSATLAFYGIGRFFIEYFRTDSPTVFLNLTVAQVACLILVLLTISTVFILKKGGKKLI